MGEPPSMSPQQIALARGLRSSGKTFPEIKELIGYTGEAGSIRFHCLDIEVPNPRNPRVDKPVRERKGGTLIRSFTKREDNALKRWSAQDQEGREALYAVARRIGRTWQSANARLQTLRKKGEI